MVPIDFHSMEEILWMSMRLINSLVTHILQNIFLCVQENKYIKGLVHPKNENSVSIYSPSCCSKPLCVYLFCWTQRKIFGRMF